jgi:proline iminopeptidase
MQQAIFLFVFLINSTSIFGQVIYSKSYGNSKAKAIIFIHGGPSGNSTLFEATTAQRLANNGFYVIVYDRRGEGRSVDTTAKYKYNEYCNDLIFIYDTYKIDKAHLIGHSFGGLVATLFAEKYPQKVASLMLVGALISQQKTYNTILKSVEELSINKQDTLMIKRVLSTKLLDLKSAEYRKACFDLASLNGFFDMPNPTLKSNNLRSEYQRSLFYKNNIRNALAPTLFYKNEPKCNINIKPVLQKLQKSNMKLFAIYGLQDKIFSSDQLNELKKIVGF